MNNNEHTRSQTSDQSPESVLAERIRICTAETALKHAVLERFYNHHFYYFQSGFLLPHRTIQSAGEACYGGLNEEQTLFVLVPVDAVQQRKRNCLLHIARDLGMDNPERQRAYCEQAEQEIAEGSGHHPHPAFQAETQACLVAFWLGLLKQRHILLSADWSW